MKLRCIAVDDEPFALEILNDYAERVPFIKMESVYTDPLEAMISIQQIHPDLVFLDIQIPEITGIRIAEVIKRPTHVIFTTAFSEYAVEGFNLNAIDYLLKPFSFERFLKAVLKAQEIIQLEKQQASPGPENEYIIVKAGYQNIKILLSDIQYIEAMDNYVRIFTPLKTHTTLMTMKTIDELLPVSQFVRIHKSFIISIHKVTTFTHETVTVGKKQIPVGRAYTSVFLASMKKE
jgi:DNA-binding LytR/AlgR family response regulator